MDGINGSRSSRRKQWSAWVRYQVPYASFAYAYFPITLTKRVLLHPRRAAQDLMARRFWDRWGWLPENLKPSNGSPSLWVHMNSGGEVIMAQSLLRQLDDAHRLSVLSSDSYDAQGLLRQWYGDERVVFPPWDTALPVARVVKRVKPGALVFVANAYFPTWLAHARRKGITTLLVNAVLSRNVDVGNRWLRRALALGAHRALDAIAVQSQDDYEAFRAMGVPADRLAITGKLEGDLSYLRLSETARRALRESLGFQGTDRVLIVGSTHLGELGLLLEAFRAIRASLPAARIIVAPRWLHEVPSAIERIRQQGFSVTTRTAARCRVSSAPAQHEVVVVDTFGELRTIYGAADVAFIGSSLVPINERRGGHNVLEPIAHGVPPLFGPHMNLWRGITNQLLSAWSGLAIDSPATLAERAVDMLAGRAPLEEIRRVADDLIRRDSGAVNRTLAFLNQWIGRSYGAGNHPHHPTTCLPRQSAGRTPMKISSSRSRPAHGELSQVVGIIPLRGSDREAQTTPEALLCGKPVLAYTIDAARQASCLRRILVSTDSQAVADVARQYGADVPFLRPAHLAAPNVPLTAVLQHGLEWLEREERYQPDVVVVLETTHPIRPPGLIDDVVQALQREELDTVFTAREERHRFWRFEHGQLVQLEIELGDHTRQQVRPVYKELAGMATAIRASVIRRGERVGERVGLVPVHGAASLVDLHDEDGWWLATHLITAECQDSSKSEV